MAAAGVDLFGTGGTDMSVSGMQMPSLLYPRPEAIDTIAGLVAVMLTSLLAASWPAGYASKLEPMEAMRA
jgi:ABC-type lipoprotein release transport system permease subunit